MKRVTCLFFMWVGIVIGLHEVGATNVLPRVTLKVDNLSLVDVLEKIKQQTGIDFMYNEKVVGEIHNITLDVNDMLVDSVMNQMLKGSKLGYEIMEKIIVIAEKKNMCREIKGSVMDDQGEGLPGIQVSAKGGKSGIVSDGKGKFQIRVPYDCRVLRFSGKGMKTREVRLSPDSREVQIKMEKQ